MSYVINPGIIRLQMILQSEEGNIDSTPGIRVMLDELYGRLLEKYGSWIGIDLPDDIQTKMSFNLEYYAHTIRILGGLHFSVTNSHEMVLPNVCIVFIGNTTSAHSESIENNLALRVDVDTLEIMLSDRIS